MPRIDVTCQACGKAFSKYDKGSRYNFCSPDCKTVKCIPVTCVECGKEFTTNVAGLALAKFCSPGCVNAFDRRTQPHKHGKLVQKNCERCGKEFSVRPHTAMVQRYCSQACSGASIGERHSGENSPVWKTKTTLTCPHCGKPFDAQPCRVGKKVYCSKECANHKDTAYCVRCGKAMELQPSRAKERVYCSIDCQLTDQAELRKDLKRTSIEVAVANTLDQMGVRYIEQYAIRWYACDFYLPDSNLIIECDGDYWHSTPTAKRNDKRKNTYLRNMHYKVIRFTESLINSDIEQCKRDILNAIAE